MQSTHLLVKYATIYPEGRTNFRPFLIKLTTVRSCMERNNFAILIFKIQWGLDYRTLKYQTHWNTERLAIRISKGLVLKRLVIAIAKESYGTDQTIINQN